MGTLFGTDGIRGVANETLDNALAYRVGLATALNLAEETGRRPVVAIGKDTRISSDMIEAALSAGLCAGGAHVVRLGVVPTPAVAFLTAKHHGDTGIVISASHNPYEYNGIKMFSSKGFKLNDALEEAIERMVLSNTDLPVKTGAEVGQIYNGHHTLEEYTYYLLDTVTNRFTDLRILIDCANGAASKTARRIFSRFNVDVTYINDQPNGVNINDHCGSTHLEALSRRVVEGYYDLGIAFDGDADRCLAVDEKGQLIDGDKIMAICSLVLREEGKLSHDTIVATVMSNLGLHLFAKDHKMDLICTDVGDRNVLEKMLEGGFAIGGEQSGHMIFLEHATTGDGQLTAMQLLRAVCGHRASELAAVCASYPQVLINVPVSSKEQKAAVMASGALKAAVAQAEDDLQGAGRVLVRPSGTEALIRVMVEAREEEIAQTTAKKLAESIKSL